MVQGDKEVLQEVLEDECSLVNVGYIRDKWGTLGVEEVKLGINLGVSI